MQVVVRYFFKVSVNNELFASTNNNTITIANIYCFGMQKRTFCYKIDIDMDNELNDFLGSIVEVSFGRKMLKGIIISIQQVEINDRKVIINNDKQIDVKKIKDVGKILYKNIISKNFLDFLTKMAFYNIICIERLFENVVLSAWLNKKRELKMKQNAKKHKKSNKAIQLNEEQRQVVDSIEISGFSVNLLYGVMGSGKTYIFLEIVKSVLSSNEKSQVLIMVPEIALTSNLIDVIYDFCGIEPIIWHSSVSVAKKKVYFDGIIDGQVRIVISTRSGLLLPYKNLSLIVIDEEHDRSYKQDEIPVYNARDMAILRAKYENIPVILVSATPSIETMVNVINKKYKIYPIKTQFFHNKPPKIELINMLDSKNKASKEIATASEEGKHKSANNYISQTARNMIINTLKKNEQSMVFINRRGFARTLKCGDCGYEMKCKNCDNLLSYHKQNNTLKCHYCGYFVSNIKKCSNCESCNLVASRGAGVEQIEDEIHSFCDAKTLIFSSDEISKESDIEKITAEIKNGDVDVIIGTQIVAKGHHFPRLTNIVVLDIDGMTLDGDFRAFEKMFQLLYQLSGRAGREKGDATIYIQTTNIENTTLKLIQNHDIKQFYKTEIQQRKKFNLPPFFRFVAIIVSSEDKNLAKQTAHYVLTELKRFLTSNVEILGPTESELYFLKRNYRYRFLLKADKKTNIFVDFNNFYKNLIVPRGTQVKIDVDPQSFL